MNKKTHIKCYYHVYSELFIIDSLKLNINISEKFIKEDFAWKYQSTKSM